MDLETIRKKLDGRIPGVIGKRKEFAVLIPLCERDGELCLLFEVRSGSIRQPGDVCFPGGKIEEGENVFCAALRETEEETGIPASEIRILGQFDSMLEVNRVRMHTAVGELPVDFAEMLHPDPSEVADCFTVPVRFFLENKPDHYHGRIIQDTEGFPYEKHGISPDYRWREAWQDVYFWHYEDHTIWGLTAGIVKWFIDELFL